MGIWGYEPYENDDALDLWDDATAAMNAVVKKRLTRRTSDPLHKWASIGVVVKMIRGGIPVSDSNLRKAEELADSLLSGDDIEWDDQSRYIASLKMSLATIESALHR